MARSNSTKLLVVIALVCAATSIAGRTRAEQRPAIAPLDALVVEAQQRSPMVLAALSHWRAQTKVPIQAATLPDPQLTLQHLTVGSPIPGAGLNKSDFGYLGFGFSQDIPYPPKLTAQRRIAERDAEVGREQYEAAVREAAEKVRENYFELFFLAKTVGLLEQSRDQLRDIAAIASSRYEVGQGIQQDVIKAQVQMTAILRELAMHHQHMHQRQAQLKAVLGRNPDSGDIAIGEVSPSSINLTPAEIDQVAQSKSPDIEMQRAMERKSLEQLKLARHGYVPDFSLQYMYQRTGDHFPDYFMWGATAKVPLYFWRKQTPAIEQSSLEVESASQNRRARELTVGADAENLAIEYNTAGRVLAIYREGLIPQARASQESAFAAYRVGKVDFQTLISAVVEAISTNQEYYRAVADHEIALARLEQITGELK